MKIGFDAKRLFCNFTGLGNHSRTTIDILSAQFPHAEFYLYSPRIVENDLTRRFINQGRSHLVMPHDLLRGSLWRTFSIANEGRRDGIELFHGLSNELPVGLHGAGIPSVVTIHDVAFRTFPDMYHAHDRFIYDQKWRYACRNADQIIAISECTKRDIIRYYGVNPDKISVVYQPVAPIYYENIAEISDEIDKNEVLSDAKQPYMLYVGSVNSRKNLLSAVKALEMLPADLRIPLVVVGGGGAYKTKVMEYVSSHHLENLIIWKQVIDNRELRKIYRRALLFVYPSFYEGFGLPVVEAALSGCPVITSNVSSLPEAGGPHSLQVDPESVEQISHAMQQLITDRSLHDRLALDARDYAMQAFHPSKLACDLMAVYEKCIGGK